MRTNVAFRHSAEFVSLAEEDGILAVGGAAWFVALLERVPGLQREAELCQEDWGVVVFVARNRKRFWVGLSAWPEGEHAWLAHIHHRSLPWLQRLTSSGKAELQRLASDFDAVLAGEPSVSSIEWYREGEMAKSNPHA